MLYFLSRSETFYGFKTVYIRDLCGNEDKQLYDDDDDYYRTITFSQILVEETSEEKYFDKGVKIDNMEETDY